MANPHSTQDLPAAKTERTIIVGYRPQGAKKNTPSLTLSGKWLREAGFETGHSPYGLWRTGAEAAGGVEGDAAEAERD